MKALEDLSVQYDDTVRNTSGGIVQFVYGDDGLDPTGMEGRDKPIDFVRVAMHIKALFPANDQPGMTPWEIKQQVEKALASSMFIGGINNGVRDKPCSELFIEDIKRYLLGGFLPRVAGEAPKYQKGVFDTIVGIRYLTPLVMCTMDLIVRGCL